MAFFGMAKILRIKGLDTNNGENKNIVGVMLILTGHIVWRLVTRHRHRAGALRLCLHAPNCLKWWSICLYDKLPI
jgi:hypothetical protein